MNDKQWSDHFIPQVTRILQSNASKIISIEVAPPDADAERATDMTIKVVGGNVAVRVRRDATRFRDLTIRSRRSSGRKTELEKIREGFADWYLYAWTINGTISEWVLVDLGRVRESGLLDKPRKEIPNKDGTTFFVGIPIAELEQNSCIVSGCTKYGN